MRLFSRWTLRFVQFEFSFWVNRLGCRIQSGEKDLQHFSHLAGLYVFAYKSKTCGFLKMEHPLFTYTHYSLRKEKGFHYHNYCEIPAWCCHIYGILPINSCYVAHFIIYIDTHLLYLDMTIHNAQPNPLSKTSLTNTQDYSSLYLNTHSKEIDIYIFF